MVVGYAEIYIFPKFGRRKESKGKKKNFNRRAEASVQFSSVAQLCPTLCNPMNRSTPGLPVHHQLPELTQTHIH